MALLFAVPLSFGAALFLVRVAPEIKATASLAFVAGLFITGACALAWLNAWPAASRSASNHMATIGAAAVLIVGFAAAAAVAMQVSHVNFSPKAARWLEGGIVAVISLGITIAGTILLREKGPLVQLAAVGAISAAGMSIWWIARNLTAAISFLIEFLAAIPSIAYGIWALFVLAPFLQHDFEPLFFRTYQRLPVTSWTQFDLYLLLPAGILVCGWLIMAVMKRSTGPFYWASRAAVAVALLSLLLAGHLLFKRPSLAWMFSYADEDQKMQPVALTGQDLFCGGLVLAIMIVPIITAIGRDILRAVPRAQIEGTSALGATWWQSSRAMLGYSRSGLFGAVMLGLALRRR